MKTEKTFGAPAGGGVRPLKSDGIMPEEALLRKDRASDAEINKGGRGIADQHLGPVEGEATKAIVRATIGKLTIGKVVTVRPGTDLTVIGKLIPRRDEIIGPIGTGRIARLGNRDRLVVRRAWSCW